jgi:signal transduction histidine kinase
LAIQVSEQRFREVFEGIELPAIMLDTGGVITFCNDSFAGLAHSSAKDLARTNWLGFIDLPAEREIWTTLLSGGADAQTSHCHFESSMHPLGVHPRRIAWNAILLRDVDGEPDGVAAIGRDVTDERALEARLLQAQKLESVGRLAGGVAHDFNNLLTVIMGYVTVALKQLDPESATYKGLLEAELAAEQCAALTQQLLAIGRRQQLRPEHISLNGVIASDEGILRAMIAQNVELVMDLEPSLGFVFADPVQIRRILANLAKNASDAMPNGGTLTIATSNADADLVRSEAQTSISPGPYVRLTVADTGIGITEEVKEHMFDPFFTTKSAGKGTGLGLSTVYGIIAQSGGYVSVRSEPGLGTTFEILLPRSQTAADTGTPGTDTHKP